MNIVKTVFALPDTHITIATTLAIITGTIVMIITQQIPRAITALLIVNIILVGFRIIYFVIVFVLVAKTHFCTFTFPCATYRAFAFTIVGGIVGTYIGHVRG
jgi:hypothetical protein